MPCVQTFALCKFSSTRQTDRLPCVEKKHTINYLLCAQIWGTRQTTPHPTNPPTHTLNRHHLPTSPPSDPPPPPPGSTPAWSPPLPYSPLLPSPPLSCQAGRPLLCLPSHPHSARPSPVVRSSGGARSGGGVLGAPPAGSELQARRELRQRRRTVRRELRQRRRTTRAPAAAADGARSGSPLLARPSHGAAAPAPPLARGPFPLLSGHRICGPCSSSAARPLSSPLPPPDLWARTLLPRLEAGSGPPLLDPAAGATTCRPFPSSPPGGRTGGRRRRWRRTLPPVLDVDGGGGYGSCGGGF